MFYNIMILSSIFKVEARFSFAMRNIIKFASSKSKLDQFAIQADSIRHRSQKQSLKQKSTLRKTWNEASYRYWSTAENSYNGVLLGYENLSKADISFSQAFYQDLCNSLEHHQSVDVLDCGAGIGRITKELLAKRFQRIDLLEQCEHFIKTAKQMTKAFNVRNYYCQGLQDFTFEHPYDCIWIQWVLTHLKDDDVLNFLKKAKNNLKPGGVIIVKENVEQSGETIDESDSTIVRSQYRWRRLFYQSELKILKEIYQPGWPEDLYELRIFALQ